MQQPFLSRPHVRYQRSYIDAAHEFFKQPGPASRRPPWNFESLEAHFDEFVETIRARTHDPLPGYVPQTDFWLIVGDQYAGAISVRHRLNPSLARFGGHIGYEIRPSMRRRGYGTLQCKLALHEARKLGLTRVLITCDDDNIGSYKIIEANGGVLQDKVDNGHKVLTRRYWINLA